MRYQFKYACNLNLNKPHSIRQFDIRLKKNLKPTTKAKSKFCNNFLLIFMWKNIWKIIIFEIKARWQYQKFIFL